MSFLLKVKTLTLNKSCRHPALLKIRESANHQEWEIATQNRPMTAHQKQEREMTKQERTQEINKLQKRHPKTRRQRSYHGAEKYSVQFFDLATGKLVADYDLSE